MGTMTEMRDAWAALSSGSIYPVVDTVLSMRRLSDAHARLENRSVVGKVVVEQDL